MKAKQPRKKIIVDAHGNDINSLAALRAKYALLDGEAEENKLQMKLLGNRKQSFKFAADAMTLWQRMPHSKAVREERLQRRIQRQKLLRRVKAKSLEQ
ncbi:MAG: hypothetical protein IAF08_03005 [Rhizobacter sp.]|nr:hypothetical protein [Chlorobiales bacterium]